MPNSGHNRRTFLALGAAGTAGVAVASVAGCSSHSQTSPSPSSSAGSATPVGTTGALAKEILADKPLLYLPFQDDADAKAPADASGNDRTVTLVGSKWWPDDALGTAAPNAVGRAFYSGVSDDKCSVKLDADAPTWLGKAPSTGVSFEMWLCQEESNYNQTLLQLVSSSDDTGWSFGLKQDGTGYNLEGPGYKDVQLTTSAMAKAWHHFAVTCDAKGHVVGYFDGKQVGTGELGAYKGTVKQVLVGSKSTQGAPLTGSWSQLAIFGSALSAERIAAHHAAGVAEADPVVRGVDIWFGGPDYYKKFSAATVLADSSRFPVAEWWWNGFKEEYPTEKSYADGAVLVDPSNDPSWARAAGVWVVRMVGMEMTGKAGAETIGWMPQDEADMDSAKMKELAANVKKIDSSHLSYANYGTGVTISSIDRYRTRPLVDRSDVDQVSADLYTYCTKPVMSQQVADAWDIDKSLVRRAAPHGMVVDRTRAFLTSAKPVWGVVAIGHANTVSKDEDGWASVPSANEVEGSIWACIVHGASGILLFPQAFADAKTAPTWASGTQYKAGDTVRDPKETDHFWYARTQPKKGVDPNDVTDDSWLSWRPNPTGIRNKDHYARGVSDRVASVKKKLQTLAPALNSRSVPKFFNDQCTTRYWPKAPDGYTYLLAMQQLEHDKGSYTFTLPKGVSVDSVEVVDEDRTVEVSKGAFSDDFEAEYTHHLYRWKA